MGPANQNPSPDQPFPLSKNRQVSTIPKAIVKEGESQFWVYPSAQVGTGSEDQAYYISVYFHSFMLFVYILILSDVLECYVEERLAVE